MMKLILAALTIYQASAAFTCDEDCAGQIYAAVAGVQAMDNGMTDLDLAVYGYILYTNVAEAGDAELTATFMAQVGVTCELTEAWTRKEVADCMDGATDDEVEAAQTAFEGCDDDNNNGCSRIMGILAHQLAPDSKIAAAFDSELSGSDTADAINLYTTFMAVVGNWEDLTEACQTAITTAADYSEGDDVVLAIAGAHEDIVEALGGEECTGESLPETTAEETAVKEDLVAAVTAMTTDLEDAVVLAEKLTTEVADAAEDDDDAESSAAVFSAVAGLIAFML